MRTDMNKATPATESAEPPKFKNAALLNRLFEMTKAPYYATACDTLVLAEMAIVDLERENAALRAEVESLAAQAGKQDATNLTQERALARRHGFLDAMSSGTARELCTLLRSGVKQLEAWHAKYGEHQPDWLPPAGDVRWMEDVASALDGRAIAQPPAQACPKCGTEEWDRVTAERGRERDVPFNRCSRCENEWAVKP